MFRKCLKEMCLRATEKPKVHRRELSAVTSKSSLKHIIEMTRIDQYVTLSLTEQLVTLSHTALLSMTPVGGCVCAGGSPKIGRWIKVEENG